MPTLKAMFKLYDGYSSSISIIERKTDSFTNKILKASSTTDNLNKKLKATGASASSAASGLTGLISAAALFAGSLKGMNIADEFTNTASRLSLINDGLQTQAELQDKIFAAAYRSKGAYSEMATAIAKMGLLAGDAFGSNNELIAFTELLQKSFKVSGASTQEQQAGMYQLTQAMAAGRLQGDEFRSIMENAPMLANAIAKFTGKSKGELKQMSAEGTITADIIKNAMFMAADDINSKFKTMPMTFGNAWNRIKNGALKAFQPVIQRVNNLLNPSGFTRFIDNIVGGLTLMATWVDRIAELVQDNWGIVEPLLYGIVGALALITFTILPAMLIQWMILNWPILLIGTAIGLLIYAMVKFGDTTAQVFGFIGGAIGVLIALIYNAIAGAFNAFMYLGDYVMSFFVDLINTVIGGINLAIRALNNIPGVDIGLVGDVSFRTPKVDFMDIGNAWTKGKDIGKGIGGSLGGLGEKFPGINMGETMMDLSSYMVNGSLPVTGANGGKVDVDMSDEDLKYLRDIAEQNYINKFSTATLAPNVTIQFGDVHEEADADKVAGRIRKILQEEIATAAEGAYA